jgi:hypothetical protein
MVVNAIRVPVSASKGTRPGLQVMRHFLLNITQIQEGERSFASATQNLWRRPTGTVTLAEAAGPAATLALQCPRHRDWPILAQTRRRAPAPWGRSPAPPAALGRPLMPAR